MEFLAGSFFLVALIWSILPMLICMVMASSKNRSAFGWAFLALFFGWIAVLFLAVASREPQQS